MGSYTDTQRFYLIDPSELVYVEQDLNYNLQKADDIVRPLVEYGYHPDISLTDSDLPRGTGYKYYKAYTNSVYAYRDGTFFQDPNAKIDPWVTTGITYEAGYQDMNTGVDRVAYCIGTDGWITFRGRVIATGSAELPLLTATNFLNVPTSILPNHPKYFYVHGGNSTGNFQTFRVFIPAATDAVKKLQFVKYGDNASSAGERYISLNDIRYPLIDTATA